MEGGEDGGSQRPRKFQTGGGGGGVDRQTNTDRHVYLESYTINSISTTISK